MGQKDWLAALVSGSNVLPLSERAARGWPPQVPPPGLLTLEFLPAWYRLYGIPREQWGAAEWRDYAAFLETEGRDMMSDFIRTSDALMETRRKLWRWRPLKEGPRGRIARGLLAPLEYPPRRGRKPNPDRPAVAVAREALRIQEDVRNAGEDITDLEALRRLAAMQGRRPGYYNYENSKNIRNLMSQERKASRPENS